ncbi:NAD(P)-dependent dehydrogenase (short-subunit alcohol dehydrogenase family) [Kribbella aluminosa]|uniref:NAD(P)-dependent dehydrogenase (Short-subunit alcohol dehydrogenase family) n=1 Tax=Kribbella aluminosa TaxID=416017 RepID=A0ABS4UX40_9ACTN|nr:SDR family oxidoreductase [Kribbella aluminosa]MBP2356183.1 NAD(P)-dependent dehydrogenase (short-subunit alcohol dehydrogenase family) [Kribbella aluminosa]
MSRTVVVTGAAGGIGRAVATRFLAEGYVVAGIDVVDPEMDGVTFHRADVTNPDDVTAAFAGATASGVDVLVACAGLTSGSPLHETTIDDWNDVLAANLGSVFLCTRAVLPAMVAAGSGVVVTVGSVLHRTTAPGLPAYAAAKGAVAALTRQLAVDYGHHGLCFVTVSPGWIRTPATESRLGDTADLVRLEESNPMRLLGTPEEVAATVAFAASPDARLLNGSELVLDAGSSVVSPASLLRDGHRRQLGLPPL